MVVIFEAPVEAAEGFEAAFVGALHDGQIGVFHQIAGVVEPVLDYVGIEGQPGSFFEIAGKVGIIIADLGRQLFQRAFPTKVFLHKLKNLIQQVLVFCLIGNVFCPFVKLGAEGI